MNTCSVEDRRKYFNFKPLLTWVLVIALALTIVVSTEAHNASAKEQVVAYTNEIGEMYGICPELLQAMIEVESQYDADVVSSAGAVGLMQIIPRYHQARMERLGVTNLYDPYSNILVGADYLEELHQKYGDDLYLVLEAYNTGNGLGYDVNNPSAYAEKIVERSESLEREHGK